MKDINRKSLEHHLLSKYGISMYQLFHDDVPRTKIVRELFKDFNNQDITNNTLTTRQRTGAVTRFFYDKLKHINTEELLNRELRFTRAQSQQMLKEYEVSIERKKRQQAIQKIRNRPRDRGLERER